MYFSTLRIKVSVLDQRVLLLSTLDMSPSPFFVCMSSAEKSTNSVISHGFIGMKRLCYNPMIQLTNCSTLDEHRDENSLFEIDQKSLIFCMLTPHVAGIVYKHIFLYIIGHSNHNYFIVLVYLFHC